MRRTLALLCVCLLIFVLGCRRPQFLTRSSASSAIEASSWFQHLTKVDFEVAQAAAVVPGVCHNFQFNPEKLQTVRMLSQTGQLKFSAYGNQARDTAERPPVGASLQLLYGTSNWLTDKIEECKDKSVQLDTGRYEVTIGKPRVVVNGIFHTARNEAKVDFVWGFDDLNEVGKSLNPVIVSAAQKSKFASKEFNGTARMRKYDDGWRVYDLKLGRWKRDWSEDISWPDPYFNWGAFDENENTYDELR
jgi:hypothetical protein